MANLTVCMPVLLSLYSFFLSPIILSLISHMPFLICCFYFRYVLKHFTILITFVSDAGTDHLYFFKMSGNTLILYTPQTIVMQLFTHSCFIFIFNNISTSEQTKFLQYILLKSLFLHAKRKALTFQHHAQISTFLFVCFYVISAPAIPQDSKLQNNHSIIPYLPVISHKSGSSQMLRNNPSVSRHGGSSRNFHLHGEGSQKI